MPIWESQDQKEKREMREYVDNNVLNEKQKEELDQSNRELQCANNEIGIGAARSALSAATAALAGGPLGLGAAALGGASALNEIQDGENKRREIQEKQDAMRMQALEEQKRQQEQQAATDQAIANAVKEGNGENRYDRAMKALQPKEKPEPEKEDDGMYYGKRARYM